MASNNNKTTSEAEDNERKYKAPALEKGLDILELLAREGGAMTTSQMATSLGRSVSELFRMVLALEYRGYIAPAEERDGYELTNKLFALGMAQTSNRSLVDVSLPVMNELARQIGQSCHLVVPSGDQVVVVARVESPRDVGFAVRLGYRRRLIDSASGLVLFGYQSDAEQQAWRAKLADLEDPGQLALFLERSEAAVAQGYVRTPSSFVDGVTDLCVPILGAQGAIAALIVPFIKSNPMPTSIDEAIEKLQDASDRISAQLGGA